MDSGWGRRPDRQRVRQPRWSCSHHCHARRHGLDDDDSECVNSSKFGNVETYLTADVPAYVRSTFRAASGPGSLAVAGLSAGGTCSTVLALRNPGIFHTFASFSGFDIPTYLDDTVAESVPILSSGSEPPTSLTIRIDTSGPQQVSDDLGVFEAGTGDHQPWTDAQQLAVASRQARDGGGMPPRNTGWAQLEGVAGVVFVCAAMAVGAPRSHVEHHWGARWVHGRCSMTISSWGAAGWPAATPRRWGSR